MTLKKQYDILELQKMDISVLQNLALWFSIDPLNKKKQDIIYEILNQQMLMNPRKLADGKKERVYLVAKISGLPTAEVTFKYENARKIVEDHGYEAVIPTECVPANSNWHYAMRLLIPIMLQCDAYTLIDEPHTTPGGLIEDTIASWVHLPRLTFSKL